MTFGGGILPEDIMQHLRGYFEIGSVVQRLFLSILALVVSGAEPFGQFS